MHHTPLVYFADYPAKDFQERICFYCYVVGVYVFVFFNMQEYTSRFRKSCASSRISAAPSSGLGHFLPFLLPSHPSILQLFILAGFTMFSLLSFVTCCAFQFRCFVDGGVNVQFARVACRRGFRWLLLLGRTCILMPLFFALGTLSSLCKLDIILQLFQLTSPIVIVIRSDLGDLSTELSGLRD